MPKKFPQSKEYELMLVQSPDPEKRELREYLDQYIKRALAKFEMTKTTYAELHGQLIEDINVAAERFLKNRDDTEQYKFSTYFSWYLKERLNKNSAIRRKTHSTDR